MNMKNLNFKYFLSILTVCIMQGVCSSCSNDDNGTASVQA